MVEKIIILITALIGTLSTYIVGTHFHQGAVRSSAGLSLLVAILFAVLPEFSNNLSTTIPLVFMGASFVGMVSSNVNSNLFFIGLGGLVFGIIYPIMGGFFTGYGGALGTAACLSLMTVNGLSITKRH